MKTTIHTLLAALIVCIPALAGAHHSPFIYFDASRTVEAEGVVTAVNWRNPHATFELTADGVSWEVEANAISILRRMDLDADSVRVGDVVTVAGWPPRDGSTRIFLTNMLIEGRSEIILWPGGQRRWSTEDTAGSSAVWLASEADFADEDAPDDIFHVWSTSLADVPDALIFDGAVFPLTEAAQAARAGYDMYGNPIIGTCIAKGMPTIMEQPYPMEFEQGDGVIYLRMEEGDIVREIHMGAELANVEPSLLGTSVGRWDGDTLVVETTGSTWPYTDMTGVPNSEDSVFEERFTPSNDGRRLDYEMTLTNPEIFTEPVTLDKNWLWIPGATVDPYECLVEADD